MLTCYRQDRRSLESAGVRSRNRLEREGKSERTFGHLLLRRQEFERSERSRYRYLLAISLRLLPDQRPLFNFSTSMKTLMFYAGTCKELIGCLRNLR